MNCRVITLASLSSQRTQRTGLPPQVGQDKPIDTSNVNYDKGGDRSQIKVAQLISRLCIGGTSVAVIFATHGLMEKGYSTVLLAGSVVGEEASMEDFARLRGVHPVRVRNLSRATSVWNDLRALWHLVQFFRREKPEIVHTHTAKAGALGRIAARIARVPVCVHTFHGHVFREHFSPRTSSVYITIEKLLASWTDCLVAVSKSQGKELIERYRVAPASKFTTIPVGLDLARYLKLNGKRGSIRRLSACAAGNPLIGWVGRMAPIKDPQLFLDVAALILAVYPMAKFVMVGHGELRAKIEYQLKERKITDAVTLIGWQADLSDFYTDVDILVMTSKHEGTPLALLEAMASGKPFVSTNVGGICDLVEGTPQLLNGVQIFNNGILTDSLPSHLKAGIGFLLDNPQLAVEMGLAGRSFVESNFKNNHSVEELDRLYLKLLNRKNLRAQPAILS
jgi:glycosyltransferase involved in cell wall biosynthesis